MPQKSGLKLISWNVNGLRAAEKAGLFGWIEAQNADIIGLQEIKARPEQLSEQARAPFKYTALWNPAEKPGYSGTALYTRVEPLSVTYGFGIPEFDTEGRVLQAEFKDFVLINAYFPNSQREHTRLDYKLRFCRAMLERCNELRAKGKHVIVCGDYNIAHRPIDLKNPKQNEDNAGFLPEERAWMDTFTAAGYVDGFRHFSKAPDQYTWWSYRPGVREKNIGWRLDYFCVNEELKDRMAAVTHRPETRGSDHCPVELILKR